MQGRAKERDGGVVYVPCPLGGHQTQRDTEHLKCGSCETEGLGLKLSLILINLNLNSYVASHLCIGQCISI